MSALALVVAIALLTRSAKSGMSGMSGRSDRTPLRALYGFAVVLALGAATFLLWPAGFRENAHTTAAIGTFLGIVAVVGLNAVGAAQNPVNGASAVRYRNTYGAIAMVMLLSAAILGIAHWQVSGWRHGVLLIEATLLIEFIVFWLVQTVELWYRTRRDEPAVLTSGRGTGS